MLISIFLFDPSSSDTKPSIPFFPLVTVALLARVVPVPFEVKEEGSCGVEGEFAMGFKTGWEEKDGGSSSSRSGAGSATAERKSADPITGVDILRCDRVDWVGNISCKPVVLVREGRVGDATPGEEPFEKEDLIGLRSVCWCTDGSVAWLVRMVLV